MVPFFAWALVADGGHTVTWRLVATGIFVLAAATDRVAISSGRVGGLDYLAIAA